MTQLKLILTAILALFGRFFALHTPAARRGNNKRHRFNFLSALCAVFFAVSVSGNTVAETGITPLHIAAIIGDNTAVKQLIQRGANVNARGAPAPLLMAAANGHTEVVRILLQEGANINGLTTAKTTPLYYAALCGHTEILHTLIKAGAKKGMDFALTGTVYEAQVQSAFSRVAIMAVQTETFALKKGQRLEVPNNCRRGRDLSENILILMDAGAEVAPILDKKLGVQYLHYASATGRETAALALVKAGVDIHAKNDDGDTPLHLATKFGNSNTAIALIDAGANVNAQGENGHTALHIVADTESSDNALKLAVALIKRGANVKAENDFGETPSDLAISKHGKDSRIARLLLKHEGKE